MTNTKAGGNLELTHEQLLSKANEHVVKVKEAATNLGYKLNESAETGHLSGYYSGYKDGYAAANPVAGTDAGMKWKNEMAKANAAQVLSGYLWKDGVIKEFIDAVEVSKRGVDIDQTKLLPVLMNFQQWIYDCQRPPKDESPPIAAPVEGDELAKGMADKFKDWKQKFIDWLTNNMGADENSVITISNHVDHYFISPLLAGFSAGQSTDAVEFAEWLLSRGSASSKNGKFHKDSDGKEYTTEELYNLFSAGQKTK